jgi:trigger factor
MRRYVVLALSVAVLAAGCGEPKITYRGLKLVRPPAAAVKAKDVDVFLEQVRNQFAKAKPLPYGIAIKRGNRVMIDFVGTIGGTPFSGGTMSGFALVVGSGQMIPGFEEGIVGMQAGQTKTIKVKFPPAYHDPALAGLPADFKITVRSAESISRPPLTDGLAGTVSGGRLKSVAELRQAAREQVRQMKLQQAEQQIRSQAAEALLVQLTWEPGNRAVNRELDRLIRQQLQSANQRGAQSMPDIEAMRAANMASVVRSLKLAKIVSSIARKEGITVSDADLEQTVGQLAQGQRQDPQQFMSYLRDNKLLDVLKRRILEDKVMGIVLQNAQISESVRPAAPAGG